MTKHAGAVPDHQRGSIIVIVAIALTALLGLGAIVTDVGVLYVNYSHLQNALDAAALAGVQELPNHPDQAQQIAEDYAAQNGVSPISVSFALNNAEIIVQAQQQVPTFFAKIWGIENNTIDTNAKAIMVPPNSLSGAVPLSIQQQSFVYGEEYVLKSGSGDGNGNGNGKDNNNDNENDGEYSGWFGALELSGPGARSYEEDLASGYNGTLSIGQIIDVKHGNMSGPTEQGINARLSEDQRVPQNTFDDFDRDAPEIIYVPIVKVVDSQGSSIQQVQIVGFAAFFLEGVEGNGNDSIVKGRFIKTVVSNGKTSENQDDLRQSETEIEQGGTSSDFGLYAPKLLQ